MAQPEQEDFVSYLDYLLDGDLPEDDEDELDVDFAPMLAGDEEEEEEEEQLDRDKSWSLKVSKREISPRKAAERRISFFFLFSFSCHAFSPRVVVVCVVSQRIDFWFPFLLSCLVF